ncbi:Uncharacterized protein Fot_50110 [Forsythia ovata]|uniref:Uncharacterized protein n=1 Tax=Forsythia ovata TaxID=205694 RepID=A0ABD1Q038_9LAMI
MYSRRITKRPYSSFIPIPSFPKLTIAVTTLTIVLTPPIHSQPFFAKNKKQEEEGEIPPLFSYTTYEVDPLENPFFQKTSSPPPVKSSVGHWSAPVSSASSFLNP